MKPLRGETFLSWAAEAGIGRDPRFKNSLKLVFQRGRSHSCYWTIPPDQEEAERLFRLVLEAVWGAGDMAVWPRDGSWWTFRERLEDLDPESPFGEIIRSLENPAALVGRDEIGELIKFLWFTMKESWRLSDDIHLISTDRSCILLLSHHQTLHASSSDLENLKRTVEHLALGGFPLLEERPDWTFKHPGTIREDR